MSKSKLNLKTREKDQNITQHKLLLIDINKIKTDPTNPNEMSDEQMDALRHSMRKFGYLEPVIIDQNYLIADGEHRVIVYREFGQSKIPAYKVNLTDIERRLLRQTKNKMRGLHNFEKDTEELIKILKSDNLDELAILLAKDAQEMKDWLDSAIAEQNKLESKLQGELDEDPNLVIKDPLETKNQCPKCGYAW